MITRMPNTAEPDGSADITHEELPPQTIAAFRALRTETEETARSEPGNMFSPADIAEMIDASKTSNASKD